MGTSPPETLHPGAPSESRAVYRSQVTLGLSGWRPVPRFARLTAVLVGVFQKTPGAVKLTFSVAPGRRQFTSHSVWRTAMLPRSSSRVLNTEKRSSAPMRV